MKNQRLIGHHSQFRNDASGRFGNLGDHLVGTIRHGAVISTATNHEKYTVRGEFLRLHHHQPMLPSGTIHFPRSPPRLRSEFDDRCLRGVAIDGFGHLPGIRGIGFGDVVIKGRLRCRIDRTTGDQLRLAGNHSGGKHANHGRTDEESRNVHRWL